MNLKNSDYVKLVFGDDTKIAERFSQVDINKIRQKIEIHYQTKKNKNSLKYKKIFKNLEWQTQLKDAFACVAR